MMNLLLLSFTNLKYQLENPFTSEKLKLPAKMEYRFKVSQTTGNY